MFNRFSDLDFKFVVGYIYSLGVMARYNGPAAMDIRQHVGATLSSHPLQQFGTQVNNTNENLLSPHSIPSPSPSIDLSSLNPSFSSNITSEFSSTFFDSSSQNSFGRNVGSATLIPLSQSQPMPPKGMMNAGVIAADEWSGTTITTSGTSNTQHQQAMQNPQGQGPTPQGAFQAKQQFVYEGGRLTSGSQVLQGLGNNRYQAVISTSQQSGGSQGGSREGLQSFAGGASQGVSSGVSHQATMQSQQGEVQGLEGTIVKSEYPVLKAPKSEITSMEGVKQEYGTQESLTQAALLRHSHDSAHQDAGFPGPTSSSEQLGFDAAPTGSQHSGLDGDTKVNHLVALQNQQAGMSQSATFPGGESPRSAYVNGTGF